MTKGLVHIYTGDGKGKTTAAIGMAVRAAGHGMFVYILQFLKGRPTGEIYTLKENKYITISRVNPELKKFYFQLEEEEKSDLKKLTRSAWDQFVSEIKTKKYDILIIDEVMGAISNGLIDLEQVIEYLNTRPETQEVILTGRNAPDELVELADYVTEMKMVKHPYKNNVPPRKGIEF